MNCPDCGSPVSPNAVVCPQCGFPLRKDALNAAPLPGAPPKTNYVPWLIGCGALLVLALVGIGIAAALFIPRFGPQIRQMKEGEAELLLQEAYRYEKRYHADRGTFTRDREELTRLGWEDRPGAFYELRIESAGRDDLCLEATPKAATGAGLSTISMDADGRIHRTVGCTGPAEDDSTSVPDEFTTDTTTPVPDTLQTDIPNR